MGDGVPPSTDAGGTGEEAMMVLSLTPKQLLPCHLTRRLSLLPSSPTASAAAPERTGDGCGFLAEHSDSLSGYIEKPVSPALDSVCLRGVWPCSPDSYTSLSLSRSRSLSLSQQVFALHDVSASTYLSVGHT